MAAILQKLFGGFKKKKKVTRKDSITGRNHTFPVPYLSRLEGAQLQPGQSLVIKAVAKSDDEFVVNLTSGPCVELEDDTDRLDNRLLSIRASIKKKKVYMNGCIDGEWGKEAIVRHDWNSGDDIDLRVRCEDEAFDIFVEHKLVAKFAHYQPVSNITHLYINGCIDLYSVSWEGKFYSVPYSAEIPDNFIAGRKLFLSGNLPKKASQFSVDFYSGENILFRFQPRFKEKQVARTYRLNGSWGREDLSKPQTFPFSKNKTFDLLFYAEENRILVFVNDVFYTHFEPQQLPKNMERIVVEGDIELLGVHLK